MRKEPQKCDLKEAKIPSLMELTQRKVYQMCYQPQVIRTNHRFKRTSRCLKPEGRLLLDDQENHLPKFLLYRIRKGPKTFCNFCVDKARTPQLARYKSIIQSLRWQSDYIAT